MQYEIGISRYGDNKKNVCGSAFIIFNENMKVENIRILRSREEELYVAMPHYKDKEGNYQDYCFPITKEFREELYGAVRKSFEESKEKQKSGDSKEQTEPSAGRDGWQEAKDTPFR